MRISREILFLLALFLFLIPTVSAQFVVGTEKNSIDGIADGEHVLIPAKIENTGQCSMECFYMLGANQKQEITRSLSPGEKFSFTINFQVHSCGKVVCDGIVDFKCRDIADGKNCMENEHTFQLVFQLTNIQPSDYTGKAPLENQSQSSGFNSDNVGTFIGLVFVILISVVLFILIIFGFYKLIKFLFFKKGKEKEGEEKSVRRLSAIMFTDMKGFSSEMNRDEEKTLKKLWRYEKAMKQIIKEHDGRIVKTIGDAIMGDFDSAVNAVKSAMSIQNLLKKEDIKIRIGIHLGDVIHKGGDVFGDGVNIASRIESISEPGEIYISEDVYNQVKGKINAGFENLGKRPLKNIDSPPRVFKIK